MSLQARARCFVAKRRFSLLGAMALLLLSTFLSIRKTFHEPDICITALEETEGQIIAAIPTTH
jgi:hypothetical protein